MPPIVPSIMVTTSVAALIAATVSGIVAQAAAGAPTAESVARTLPLPQEVLPGQTHTLIVDSPVDDDADSVLAWHGQGRSAELRRFADRAAAVATNDLTTFDARALRNGYTKLVGGDGRCLALEQAGTRLVASLNAAQCNFPASNWSLDGGKLLAAQGSAFVGTEAVRDGLSVVDSLDRAADVGIDLRYQGPVPAVDARVTVPERFDRGPELTATTRPLSTVTIADVVGQQLATAVADADGAVRVTLPARQSRGPVTDVLVSVVERGADRLAERSWIAVPYGDGLQLDASVVVADGAGNVVLTGRGEVGASVRVVRGASAQPTVVGPDGRWRIAAQSAEVGGVREPILVRHTGFGALTTEETVTVRAAGAFNGSAVFPADHDTAAFVEGTSDPGARVAVVSSSGDPIGETTADRSTGYYRVTVPAPDAGGATTVRVTERDDAGEVQRSGDVRFDWGTAVQIASPTEGADFGGDQRVSGIGDPGAEVELGLDGAAAHAVVGPTGRWATSLSAPLTTDFGLTSASHLVSTSNGTPSLTGTGKPGATVSFVPDTGRRTSDDATTKVRADGTWRIPGAALGDFSSPGTAKPITGSVRQDPGTPGAAGAPVEIRPDVRAFQVLSPVADGTLETADGIVRYTGTGTPGTTVAIRDAQDRVSTTLVLADGTWESAEVPVADGPTTARVTGTGTNGVTTTDVTFTVRSTSDRQHTVTSPTAGSTVVPEASDGSPVSGGVRFTGTAPAGASITVINEARGGREVETTTDGDGTWSVLVPGFDAGPASALVLQLGGGVPVRVPFTVATEAGSQVVVTSPQPGSTVELVADNAPFKDWVEVTGTARASAAVSVFNRKIPNAQALVTADADGRWRALVRAVPGPQEFRVEAAGSVPVTVEFTATD